MSVLITGGLGYLGSHIATVFAEHNVDIILLDNMSNSSPAIRPTLKTLMRQDVFFVEADITKADDMKRVFTSYNIDCVLHCAQLESHRTEETDEWSYYKTNVGGTITLCNAMSIYGCKHLLTASTSSVYDAQRLAPPYHEDDACSPSTAYATSKYMMEIMLKNIVHHYGFTITNLRYAKTIGAHTSGLLGRSFSHIDIITEIYNVAQQKLSHVTIHGNEYPTVDGTFARDYIHVMDVAQAYYLAYEHLHNHNNPHKIPTSPLGSFTTYNIGSGHGTTALELLKQTEKITGHKIPHVLGESYHGKDVCNIVDWSKVHKELRRSPDRTLSQAIQDGWNAVKYNG